MGRVTWPKLDTEVGVPLAEVHRRSRGRPAKNDPVASPPLPKPRSDKAAMSRPAPVRATTRSTVRGGTGKGWGSPWK